VADSRETGSAEIESILVVGGGTAGWMSAVFLNRALGGRVRVTVVESQAIGTIGVGEATFRSLKHYFDFCGLSEQEWMPPCHATFKFAIKFVDWTAERGAFYHPFEQYPTVRGIDLPEWWLRTRRGVQPFDMSCFVVPGLCEAKRSPRYLDGSLFDERALQPYGYHFDAKLLGDYLRSVGVQRGVHQVCGDVKHVTLGSRGEVASVSLADGRTLTADLFVDCTGFRGLLINQALGEPFLPFGDSLLCDSAVAMRVPTHPDDDINPYTTATALDAGWVWDIPLSDRVGTGYVYCSGLRTNDEAEEEFRRHLGARAAGVDAFHLKMRTGRTRNPWVKNCVSVGLSCGFVEPLESTGIFFIQYSLNQLLSHFPSKRFEEAVIRNYNAVVGACIDGVRDFLILHYYANDRRDTPFWNAVKDDIVLPERLGERFELWRARLPNDDNVYPEYHGFRSYSWLIMLLGLNYQPATCLPLLEYHDDTGVDDAFDGIQRRSRALQARLPSHAEYVRSLQVAAGASV
jgi:tryptophan halogenase